MVKREYFSHVNIIGSLVGRVESYFKITARSFTKTFKKIVLRNLLREGGSYRQPYGDSATLNLTARN